MSSLLPSPMGYNRGSFSSPFIENDLKTMAKMLYKDKKYMNVEDTMIAQRDGPKKRQRQDDHRLDRGRKLSRMSEWDERKSKPPSRMTKNFTPLNTPLDQVLTQIKDEWRWHGQKNWKVIQAKGLRTSTTTSTRTMDMTPLNVKTSNSRLRPLSNIGSCNDLSGAVKTH